MLNRRQLVQGVSLAPAVAPMVRIPPNGCEMAQWHAKQVLDIGAYGVVWPHISSVDEAYSAVSACRYPRLKSAPRYHPAGLRGDGPTQAVRYWGLTQQEYYERADVWPLDPKGEIFVILQMEDTQGIENLDEILTKVPGIGCILIGEGDLSQELGYPRQYEHPEVLKWMARVVETCKKHKVAVGHPHVDANNAERILKEGYTFLMCAPVQSFGGLNKGRELAGR
jgi:4-hydroxy-2-oxoheptanedioate aldolase